MKKLKNYFFKASNLQNEPFEYFDFDFDFNLADQFQFTDKSIENINKEINQSNENQIITEFQNVTNIESNNSTCISSCQEINENDEEMKLTDIKSPVIDLIPINQKLFEDAFNNIKQTSTVSPSRNILKSILTMEPNNPSIDKPGYFK